MNRTHICDDFAALLSRLLDEDLDAGERLRVLMHLDNCPGCRSYYEALCAMHQGFTLLDCQVPDGFAEGVMARIRAIEAPPTLVEAAPVRSKRPFWRTALPMAACAALVLLGAWPLLREQGVLRNEGAPQAAMTAMMDSAAAVAESEAEPQLKMFSVAGGEAMPDEEPADAAPLESDMQSVQVSNSLTLCAAPSLLTQEAPVFTESVTLPAAVAEPWLQTQPALLPYTQEADVVTYLLTEGDYALLRGWLAENHVAEHVAAEESHFATALRYPPDESLSVLLTVVHEGAES